MTKRRSQPCSRCGLKFAQRKCFGMCRSCARASGDYTEPKKKVGRKEKET